MKITTKKEQQNAWPRLSATSTFCKRMLVICLALGMGVKLMHAQAPTVTTDTRFARGATMAFGRMTAKANGSALAEQGFCWSESKEPTVDDFTTTDYLTNNGKIYWMKNLKPATMYYARAYAKAKDGSVGYGDVIKIVTIPKGQIQLSFRTSNNADADARIKAAAEEAVDWWNNLTEMRNFYPSVGFVDGVQTADCSYGGWVRVGSNQSYQRCGTILHELLHGCGVIPWADTEWSRHTLRSSQNGDGYGSGYWLGDRVTEVLRFWDNSTTSQLNGDYQHMWPYGINGAQEDNGSDVLYIGNSLICQALGEDGLQHTSTAYNEPYYAFDQEDDVKYYIKSESEKGGLYTSYLVSTDNNSLRWKEMTEEEVLADDAAAWYFTFTPSNQFYQIRNAKTGRYIDYNTNSNVFKLVDPANKNANDDFNINLMKGRVDVALGDGSKTWRGYWFIHPEDSWTPRVLTAGSNNATSKATFNISNTATAQRWLILAAEEVYELNASRTRFLDALADYQALLDVPHTQDNPDAEEALRTAVETATTKMETATTPDVFSELSATLKTAAIAYLAGATVTDYEQPFNITCLLTNADFSMPDMEGWAVTGTMTNEAGVGESQGKAFNIKQELKSAPKGVYEVRVNGFERAGELDDAFAAYLAEGTTSSAMCYIASTSNRQSLSTIFDDRQSSALDPTDAQLSDGTYVPTTLEAASARFEQGMYEVTHRAEVTQTPLQVGVRSTKTNSSYWTVVDNFRLYFYGAIDIDAVGIDDVPIASNPFAEQKPAVIFDLSGRQVQGELQPGIYIVGGKKVLKTK